MRSARRIRSADRGAATVWTAFAACALCVVFGAVLALGQAVAARHRAGAAADLAALAAAGRVLWGEQDACAAAARVAAAQGATLVRCHVREDIADVTTRVAHPPWTPESRARAGPPTVPPSPTSRTSPVVPPSPTGRTSPVVPPTPTGGTSRDAPPSPIGRTSPADPISPVGLGSPSGPGPATGLGPPADPGSPTGLVTPVTPEPPASPDRPTVPGSFPGPGPLTDPEPAGV